MRDPRRAQGPRVRVPRLGRGTRASTGGGRSRAIRTTARSRNPCAPPATSTATATATSSSARRSTITATATRAPRSSIAARPRRPTTTAGWIGKGALAYGYFGYSVASAGDVNGDGYGDIIVGAIYDDQDETDEGRAYLFLGSASGPGALPAWTAESDQANAALRQLGRERGRRQRRRLRRRHRRRAPVRRRPERRGQGVPSISARRPAFSHAVVDGAMRSGLRALRRVGVERGRRQRRRLRRRHRRRHVLPTTRAFDEGRAFVYLGSASGLSPTPAWTAESDQSRAFFGNSVARAGDVNGDGYSDVIVGAYAYDNGEANEGARSSISGRRPGLVSSRRRGPRRAIRPTRYFGITVAGAGDVNGDGYGDVIVGAHGWDRRRDRRGQASRLSRIVERSRAHAGVDGLERSGLVLVRLLGRGRGRRER